MGPHRVVFLASLNTQVSPCLSGGQSGHNEDGVGAGAGAGGSSTGSVVTGNTGGRAVKGGY